MFFVQSGIHQVLLRKVGERSEQMIDLGDNKQLPLRKQTGDMG